MNNLLFSVFPSENFVDLTLFQYGREKCSPAHSFGPAARNHYLFHYVISGTGRLFAYDKNGETREYHIKSTQGFMIFPNQITTYVADKDTPWEYVWIEFDGLMYQQQNAIHGIGTLLQQMDSLNNGAQLHSLLFNHWRTAENRTTFRYAAETTLGPTVMPDPFYRAYATRLGIADTDTYGRAMHLIDQADQFSKDKLGNIGFCWVGAWRNGGSYTWMNPDHIAHCSQLYVQAGKLIAKLYGEAATSPARSYLELLGNRVLCSSLYMDAFREATAIRTIHKDADGQVPPEERQRAVEICNHALLGFERYMQTYARLLPDRGSEGTVMSVWFSPMRGLRILRSQWGGTPLDEPAHSDRPLDEPPLPIFYE